MFDTHTLYPHKSSPARPSSQRNLLCRSSRPQARRPKSRFQRGSSVETLLSHQDAEPRRLSRRDRSTAAPPTATTTQIYAKVDIKALRTIAMPWMGGAL